MRIKNIYGGKIKTSSEEKYIISKGEKEYIENIKGGNPNDPYYEYKKMQDDSKPKIKMFKGFKII